jgi:hypothetical protein
VGNGAYKTGVGKPNFISLMHMGEGLVSVRPAGRTLSREHMPSASNQRVPIVRLERCAMRRSWFGLPEGAPCGADRHKIGPYQARA